ncbi:MAG: hypothetical protein H6746_08220 [Deltaproteobacteria bacterium]|nr:hypothetical protein [Deltaproteobacteria bacterium]
MKRFIAATLLTLAGLTFVAPPAATAAEPKAKFYDFSDQLIDGDIKKPQELYTNVREQVKFDRLLSLKKSFVQSLLLTAKERVFK